MSELPANGVDRRRHMHLGVRVNPAGHGQHLLLATRVCHHGHRRPVRHLQGGTHSQTTDKTVMGAW
jgi:hypothetical protein